MRPNAFPPAHRILRGAAFERVFRGGASAADGLLAVHVLPRGEGSTRLGLAVGRNVGGAVLRNRVKRRLREAFRVRRTDLPAAADIVVRVRAADAAHRPAVAFEASLVALAGRAAAAAARRRPGGPPAGPGGGT